MGEKKRRAKAGLKDLHYPNFPEERRREIVRLANETMDLGIAAGHDGIESLREDFKADIVYGVWQEDTAQNRIVIACLKGYGRMKLISQASNAVDATECCLRFSGRQEAWVAASYFGDLRQDAPDWLPKLPG